MTEPTKDLRALAAKIKPKAVGLSTCFGALTRQDAYLLAEQLPTLLTAKADLEEAAKDLVALWHSPKISVLTRQERNAAIEDARQRLTQAVKSLYGQVRDRDVEKRVRSQ